MGQLWVVAAPSGAGKTSLVNALLDRLPGLRVSVSYTTRPPRPGEKTGENYFFVDVSEFERMIETHAFLEHAKVFGHYYGTEKKWVEEQLSKEIDIILEIDWQGAQQIKAVMPDSLSIFILPPSLKTLAARLEKRAQDTKEVIEQRLREATLEMSHCEEFDYLIVNDTFDTALRELQLIIESQRFLRKRQVQKYGTLLKNLRE